MVMNRQAFQIGWRGPMGTAALLCCFVLVSASHTTPAGSSLGVSSKSLAVPHKWSVVAVPPPAGSSGSSLSSVSCITINDCFAVGSAYQGFVAIASPGQFNESPSQHPLIEDFNGRTWHQIPSPQTNGALLGVDCVSADFCVAVGGQVSQSGQASTLIEGFDGKRWRVLPSVDGTSPSVLEGSVNEQSMISNSLNAVSCPSIMSCVAVGETSAMIPGSRDGVTVPLSEHYNGAEWVLDHVSDNWQGSLVSLSCAVARCTAVGIAEGIPTPPYVASGQFTGTFASDHWQRLNSPQAEGAGVVSLACSGASCVGAGGQVDGPYIARLFSNRWHTVSINKRPSTHSQLNGIACLGVGQCVAVGTSTPVDTQARRTTTRLLVELGSGTTWTSTPLPTVSNRDEHLTSVTCLPARGCISVGYSQLPSVNSSGNAAAIAFEATR